jgi:hypothetical protein
MKIRCQILISDLSVFYNHKSMHEPTFLFRSGTPTFWRQITTGDWQEAYQNLRNFGDSYPTRRREETRKLTY